MEHYKVKDGSPVLVGVKYKTVTVPLATVGPNWSAAAREIGTASQILGVHGSKILSIYVANTNFNPAALAFVGIYEDRLYLASTVATTCYSDSEFRLIYTD